MANAGLQGRRWRIDPVLAPVQHAGRGCLAGFLDYRPAVFASILVLLVLVVSIMAPLMTPYGRDAIDLDDILASPSPDHVLGTDELGRDVFTRLIYGGRFTLLVAFLSVAIATALGVVMGTAAGYLRGAADHIVTAAVDLFLSIPVFLVLLVVSSIAGAHPWTIPLVIGATTWMETARLVRAEFLSLRGEGFVEAARSMGVRDMSIVFKHMLPQALPPVIVAATVGFAQAMLIESALSFLGFGIQPPLPTWGNMLYNAQVLLRRSTAAAFTPGLMIFITCLCFSFIGGGLRRSLARER